MACAHWEALRVLGERQVWVEGPSETLAETLDSLAICMAMGPPAFATDEGLHRLYWQLEGMAQVGCLGRGICGRSCCCVPACLPARIRHLGQSRHPCTISRMSSGRNAPSWSSAPAARRASLPSSWQAAA